MVSPRLSNRAERRSKLPRDRKGTRRDHGGAAPPRGDDGFTDQPADHVKTIKLGSENTAGETPGAPPALAAASRVVGGAAGNTAGSTKRSHSLASAPAVPPAPERRRPRQTLSEWVADVRRERALPDDAYDEHSVRPPLSHADLLELLKKHDGDPIDLLEDPRITLSLRLYRHDASFARGALRKDAARKTLQLAGRRIANLITKLPDGRKQLSESLDATIKKLFADLLYALETGDTKAPQSYRAFEHGLEVKAALENRDATELPAPFNEPFQERERRERADFDAAPHYGPSLLERAARWAIEAVKALEIPFSFRLRNLRKLEQLVAGKAESRDEAMASEQARKRMAALARQAKSRLLKRDS
jgi:hypothetical protein